MVTVYEMENSEGLKFYSFLTPMPEMGEITKRVFDVDEDFVRYLMLDSYYEDREILVEELNAVTRMKHDYVKIRLTCDSGELGVLSVKHEFVFKSSVFGDGFEPASTVLEIYFDTLEVDYVIERADVTTYRSKDDLEHDRYLDYHSTEFDE